MHVLKDEDPKANPQVKAFLDDVLKKEEEAFNRIFSRFCILNAVKFDVSKVETTRRYPEKPNYGEYYYIGYVLGNPASKHFLMSRDLVMVEGQELPVLNVTFNKNLLDESKEN